MAENSYVLILVKFKFDYFNWRKLMTFRQTAKLKSSPNFPAILYIVSSLYHKTLMVVMYLMLNLSHPIVDSNHSNCYSHMHNNIIF